MTRTRAEYKDAVVEAARTCSRLGGEVARGLEVYAMGYRAGITAAVLAMGDAMEAERKMAKRRRKK